MAAETVTMEALGRNRDRYEAMLAEARKDPKAWHAAHRDDARKGFKRPMVRFVARNHPELFEDADRDTANVGDNLMARLAKGGPLPKALDKEKIIAFLERIIPILRMVAPFTGPYAPAVLAAVVVLQLIVDRYHANNSGVGLGFEDL